MTYYVLSNVLSPMFFQTEPQGDCIQKAILIVFTFIPHRCVGVLKKLQGSLRLTPQMQKFRKLLVGYFGTLLATMTSRF